MELENRHTAALLGRQFPELSRQPGASQHRLTLVARSRTPILGARIGVPQLRQLG